MKKVFFGLLFIQATTFAQSISPEVIASSGTRFSTASNSIEFTIGEVATSSLTGGSNTLTQGFHQPEIHFASIDEQDEYIFNLYPNPTEQFVTIESTNEGNIKVQVFDMHGQMILTTPVFNLKTTIDLQILAAGSYILRVSRENGEPLHSYSLIKKSSY